MPGISLYLACVFGVSRDLSALSILGFAILDFLKVSGILGVEAYSLANVTRSDSGQLH